MVMVTVAVALTVAIMAAVIAVQRSHTCTAEPIMHPIAGPSVRAHTQAADSHFEALQIECVKLGPDVVKFVCL